MQILTANKFYTKTYILNSSEYLEKISRHWFFPIILKSLTGSHGSGVSIVESKRGLNLY